MKYVLWLFLFWCCGAALAAEDIYSFASPDTAREFRQLTTEFRCLVCQNQSLADSNAPLAEDLRLQIYRQLSSGQTPAAIRAYLLARYGQFITYKPPFQRNTALLWCAPLILFSVGVTYLLLSLARHSSRDPGHDPVI